MHCRIKNHAPLRGAAVGHENWVPAAAGAGAGGGWLRSFGVAGQRRAGWKLHSCLGAPAVVTGWLWTVRGRELSRCRGPLPGNPRCCCVRVCQAPVLTRALAGGAPSHRWGDAAAGGGQAHEGAVRARRRDRRAQEHDCAARRPVVFPVQPGGIRRVFLGLTRSTVVRCRYQCSAAIAVSGLDTSRLVMTKL